ncbi:DDE-type integrase/transposase/recombinase [Caballeronia sp. EK]|uniref:DDE-type integrase/transposase/recombinase n=1 Tax=Caballeronia sp. EK TaxID=2767469 RepID=UPI00210637BF|nr:DDE-type integrase/transposase/recombinase [Caballeronia sp. EK]
MKYAFIERNRRHWPISVLCEVLEVSNDALLLHIKAIHAHVKGEYGWPRMWKDIATTNSNHNLPIAPDLLEPNFTAAAPNQVWTSDITYVATAGGCLYLADIIDPFSRQVVGLSMQPHMKAGAGDGRAAHGMVPAPPRSRRDCA